MRGVVGLLLAAGAGARFGSPKALARDVDGTSWLLRSVDALRPCAEVVVVLGAHADAAASLLPEAVPRVVVRDWQEGMGASLRAGLGSLFPTKYDAALISLVDLPDVGAAVTERIIRAAHEPGDLARAVYDGRPGHPVLLGRDHWASVIHESAGDMGARQYLSTHDVVLIECADLANGADIDHR